MYSASSDTDHIEAGIKSALHSLCFETINTKLHK